MSKIHQDLRENFEEFFVQAFAYMLPDTKLEFEPYLKLLCHRFQNIGDHGRYVFNLPPRSLKSWTTKFFVAWYLGHYPSRNVMIVCNKQQLAEKYVDEVREIMNSEWYKAVFPNTKIRTDRSSADRFLTTRRGGVLAASVRGSVAGFGADLLILDDPNKIADAQRPASLEEVNAKYDDELYSRLNNKKKSVVICVQHRLASGDLSGHLIERGYKVTALPFIAPRDKKYRIGDEVWKRRVGDVLTKTYPAAEIALAKQSPIYHWFYQQGIGQNDKKRIRMEDFPLFETKKAAGPFVVSIDCAQSENAGSSFSVIQAWQKLHDGSLHLFHQFRARCPYTQLQDTAKSFIRQFQPVAVLIETTGANGAALLSVLEKQLPHINFKDIKPRQSKAARLDHHRKLIRQGKVSLRASGEFLVDFLLEFTEFPARGTDIVDAATQVLDFTEANPIWPRPAVSREAAGPVGVKASDGRPIPRFAHSANESGPPGIAIARGRPFF